MKLNRSMISPTLNQSLVANYLKDGTYHRHLRKLRKIIKRQHQYCAAAICKYFPNTVKMTVPLGGLSLWIELPTGIKGSDVYYEARNKGISILLGCLCSSLDTYDRYIRIGYGGCWDNDTDQAIQTIGTIIKQMAGERG
jgi:DNA-binding transcriptional MocR family regulator